MSNEWYIRVNDKTYGPASLEKLKQYIQKGQLTPNTLVRCGREGQWQPAGDFAELFEPPPQAAPPPRQVAPPPPRPAAPPVVVRPATPPPPQQVPQVIVTAPPLAPSTSAFAPLTAAAPNVAVQVNVSQSKTAHSLGIGAMVLGIVGLLTVCFPFISLPLSGLGFLLGAFGLGMAIMRKGTGIGFSIAGAAISGVIFLPSLLFWTTLAGAVKSASDEFANKLQQAEQTNQTPLGGTPSETAAEDGDAAEWADASEGVRQGDIEVRVTSVKIDHVELKDFTDDARSKGKLAIIELAIANRGQTKKLQYESWSGSASFLPENVATLSDSFDNRYQRITFGALTSVPGQLTKESVYPGKSVADLLIFEPPIATAEFLKLELPAGAFGGTGMLRLKIPRSMISGSAD
jgi:hypothetical protein